MKYTKFKLLTPLISDRIDGFACQVVGFAEDTEISETPEGTLIITSSKNSSIIVLENSEEIRRSLNEFPETLGGLDLAIPLPSGRVRY